MRSYSYSTSGSTITPASGIGVTGAESTYRCTDSSRTIARSVTISLVFNALAYTAFLFLYIFTCWPREKIWDPSVEGKCMDSNKLNMAIGGLNTFSDIEAFFVPIWAIWKLKMCVKAKLAIWAVFTWGAL